MSYLLKILYEIFKDMWTLTYHLKYIKVFLTNFYLIGHDKTWWCLWLYDTSCEVVMCWANLVEEIMAQLWPFNLGQVTCIVMYQLQYIASIKNYVEKFYILVIKVHPIDEEDKFHYFIEGFQLWA